MDWLMVLNGFMVTLRALLVFTKPLSDKLLDVFCRIFIGGTKPLPPIKNKILLMSATELAGKIRKKELSSLKVMQAYIDRIQSVQPVVNPCVDQRFKEALAEAAEVDQLLLTDDSWTEERLVAEKPLLGVPFTCKELIGVKGLAQTCGMMKFKDRKAPEDADATALYRKAGAIPVVVTNVPTMLLWWDTCNPVFGATLNPYDNNRAAGGSSGGEAVLICSAGAVVGIGNDLGGSIRIPATFCGIYGHKPSQGVVSNNTAWPGTVQALEPYMSTGPMCRYAEDLHLLMCVLCPDGEQSAQLSKQVDFSKVKIYYMETLPGPLLSATADVRSAVRKAAKYFEQEFNTTATELKFKELKQLLHIWLCKAFEAAGPFIRPAVADGKDNFSLFWEYLKCLFGCSDLDCRILYFTALEIRKKDKAYQNSLDRYDRIKNKFDQVLDGDAILILPSQPESPPHSIVTIPKLPAIDYTCLINILGYPATQIPAGLSKGLPIGIQVIAAKGNDHLTLAAAVELDKVFNGWKSPCPIMI